MNKVRNAVIIIILCVIGASVNRKANLGLLLPPPTYIQDTIAGHQAGRHVVLAPDHSEPLQDAVAGHSALPPRGKPSNTLGDIPGAPRGNGLGGIGSLPNDTRELSPYKP